MSLSESFSRRKLLHLIHIIVQYYVTAANTDLTAIANQRLRGHAGLTTSRIAPKRLAYIRIMPQKIPQQI